MVLKNFHTMIRARNITIIAISVMAAFASVISDDISTSHYRINIYRRKIVATLKLLECDKSSHILTH
jgi:hypothetical protein